MVGHNDPGGLFQLKQFYDSMTLQRLWTLVQQWMRWGPKSSTGGQDPGCYYRQIAEGHPQSITTCSATQPPMTLSRRTWSKCRVASELWEQG